MIPAADAALDAVADAFRTFICRACGLIYDEALGDPDSGLAPGTRWEDIPDDWCCPLCGVGKADFEPYVPDAAHVASHVPGPVASLRGDPGVLIVGAGHAGWQVAQALRERDPQVPITLVSACAADVYHKPTLSVACAQGLEPAEIVRERGDEAAQRLGVRLMSHTRAVSIDAPARRLRTTRGSIRYRKLVLAQGADPAVSSVLPLSLVWTVNDLWTYQRLRASLDGASRRIVIVGAGLVGSELANDFALAGHQVTLLGTQALPLPAHLPAQAAYRLIEAWRNLPLSFVGHSRVTSVERSDEGIQVRTTSGRTLMADEVIAATGLRTPRRLARSAGLAYDDRAAGIVVDGQWLRTSDTDIHALGDCVAIAGRSSRFVEPITRQASAIAAALVGQPAHDCAYAPVPALLQVKTASMPITLEGDLDAVGTWQIDSDDPLAFAMSKLDAEAAVVARLSARCAASAAVRTSAESPPPAR